MTLLPNPPKNVLLYGNATRPRVRHAIEQVQPLIEERSPVVSVSQDRELDLSSTAFDLLIAFGGDGSLLGLARRMGHRQRPIVGVNFGKVGFLACFELPDLLVALDELFDPQLSKELIMRECIMQEVLIRRADGSQEKHFAMNEVVISRGALSRMIGLECWIDGALVTHYDVDGLIVSTPAGSTAHSLSAGGPVLEQELEAFVITPICPLTLAIRPLVVRASRRIKLRVAEAGGGVFATIDGHEVVELGIGDDIEVRVLPQKVSLVAPRTPGYYANLRTKLLWGGRMNPAHPAPMEP